MSHYHKPYNFEPVPTMPLPRKQLINLDNTTYYHCISRCVRRAYLCGKDSTSGKSYEHRKQWVENRSLTLSSIYAIDICAYAVMSNHTHLVLNANKAQAQSWSIEEVLHRWHRLHKGTFLTRQFVNKSKRKLLTQHQLATIMETVEIYRKRLYDISWYMRHLNEYIARRANKEDDCTGRFWEGRFKSQALLDEASLLACMAYVDLNPMRAGLADKPEDSLHTSIRRRILAAKVGKQAKRLAPFVGSHLKNINQGIPFSLREYLLLVDYIGRENRDSSPMNTPEYCESILERTGLLQVNWSELVYGIENKFASNISLPIAIRRLAS